MTDWKENPANDLERAIADFKRELPGWWFSVGECQVSCDASCAPTVESDDIALIKKNRDFDSGFHVNMAQPSSLAAALDHVRDEALKAKELAE